jgi:hypothetical protein
MRSSSLPLFWLRQFRTEQSLECLDRRRAPLPAARRSQLTRENNAGDEAANMSPSGYTAVGER